MGRRFQDALIKLQAIHRLGDYSSVSCGEIGLPEISWQSVNFPELEDGGKLPPPWFGTPAPKCCCTCFCKPFTLKCLLLFVSIWAMKTIPLWGDSIYLEKFMEVEPPAPELPILWFAKSIKPGPQESPDLS